MNEESFKGRVEAVAQLATVLAVGLYVCGFVVISVHHSSFGIPQLNLFRPKILFAGVLFFLLAGVSVLETLRISSFRNFASASKGAPQFKAFFALLPLLTLAMVGSGLVLRQVFVGGWFESGTHVYWGAAGLFVTSVLLAIPEMRPWPTVVKVARGVMAVAWLVFCLYRTKDTTLWILVGWLFWCSMTTLQTYGPLTSVEKLRAVNVVQAVLGVVATFAFFGGSVYSKVPAVLGGGQPVPATLSFLMQDKQPPVGTTHQLKVWMLDETDAGFYFLQTKDAKKAVFVPRASVSAIYFGD